MNTISTDTLLTTYQVLTMIMKENHLTQDTSFVRVKNMIANMVCDGLLNNN